MAYFSECLPFKHCDLVDGSLGFDNLHRRGWDFFGVSFSL